MIFKPKIKKVLQYLSISAIALTVALSINTIQAHASGLDQKEMDAFFGKSSSAESTGQGGTGGNDSITNGVSNSRTGYLCYMLTTDGQAFPGTNAVAFKSPGFSYYSGDKLWLAKSRKGGYSVSDFKEVAPWGCIPWEGRGTPTNEPRIKEWMLTKDSAGIENTAKFIKDNFGMDAALAYGKKEAILVVETLMHFQFSREGTATETDGEKLKNKRIYDLSKKYSAISLVESKIQSYKRVSGEKYEDLLNQAINEGLNFLDEYGFTNTANNIKKNKDPDSRLAAIELCVSSLKWYANKYLEEAMAMDPSEFVENTGGRVLLGPTLVGTVPELVKYKAGLSPQPGVFDSFINGAACEAEYMTAGGLGEQAGFIPWDGSTRNGRYHNSYGNNLLSNDQVTDLAVAMMVFTAQTDIQTTCDEPQQPSPHKAPVESTGTTTIIKNYRTKEGTTLTDDGCFVTQNVSSDITIESEGKYQVVGWKTSSSTSTIPSITWPVPSALRSGTTSSTIKLDSTEKCLYVLLEKTETPPPEAPADYNYKLTESSITRRVHFTAPDNRLTLPYIENHTFQWIIPAHQTSCPGNHPFTNACHGQHIGPHTASCEKGCPATCTQEHPSGSHIEACSDPHYYDCGTRCQTQYASCSGWQWHEKQLKLSINNTQQSNYPDILATKSGWNTEPQNSKLTKHYYLNDASFERTSTSSQSYSESNWDYVAVLLRGKDKLTIAHWQNAGSGSGLTTAANTDLQGVSPSGFTIANSDSGTRKTQDYMETFSTYFSTEESEGVDNYTYYKSTIHATVPAPDTPKGSTLCGINERKAYISNPLSINNIKVKVETYSGSSSGGTNDTSFNASPVLTLSRQGYDVSSGRMIQTGSTISFRPYIKMKYDTLTATNQPAYVLSEYQRQMTPNAYAEISWNNPGARNLTLTSAQWSTHAQATQNHGTNSVLPGGATLSLNINADNRQQVTVTSYYPIITGHGKTQIDNAGGSYTNLTEATAQSLHEQFVSSVQQALDTTIIQQYVDTDDTKSTAFGGIQVNPGSSITELHNGSTTASTEDKYYFRPDNTASGLTEGDLDVQQSSNTETTYTFFTTTNGALKMTINNTTPKENTPDQGAYSYIGNMLDARTGVRTKLEAAVERYTGSDPEAITGTNWYNEAFDGVTIIQFDTVLTVGFQDPPERSQVLDPKLIPKQVNSTTENKDLFSDYFISQFRTRNYSELNQTPYIMGRYNGQTVQMINLEKLFTSRPFYIPNLTTQDLH